MYDQISLQNASNSFLFFEQLMGYPQAGNSWEGFVIQQMMVMLPNSLIPSFYRTAAGAELDLVLVKGITVTTAIEIVQT
jgi:hypothetical protein